MNEDTYFIGLDAVNSPNWKWMPGMLYVVNRPAPLEPVVGRVPDQVRGWAPYPGAVPNFDDPATLGCLLALVRQVVGDPGLHVRLTNTARKSDGLRAWEVQGRIRTPQGPVGHTGTFLAWGYATEAAALVDTLSFSTEDETSL